MDTFVNFLMPFSFFRDVNDSWPLNYYVEDPSELWRKFDTIGYFKSACVLRMFQETLTDSTFAKGLNYFLVENFMKAVTPKDLHKGLQRAFNEDFPGNLIDIESVMSSWENQAGV